MSGAEFQPMVTGVVSTGVAVAAAELEGAGAALGVAAPPQAEKTIPKTTAAAMNLDRLDIVPFTPRRSQNQSCQSHAVACGRARRLRATYHGGQARDGAKNRP